MIYARFVAKDGTFGGPRFVVADELSPSNPRITFGNGSYLAAWHSSNMTIPEIWARMIAEDGTLLEPVPVCTGQCKPYYEQPGQPASAGGNYLVAYDALVPGGRKIRGRLLETDGTLGPELLFDHAGLEARSAGSDTSYLVVWQREGSGALASDVMGRIVQPDGSVGDTFAISDRGEAQTSQDVAFDGSNFLVVFISHEAADVVFGQFVSPDGTLLYTTSDTNFIISDAPGAKSHPQVDCSDGKCMVVWEDNRLDMEAPDLFFQKVAGDGSLLETPSSENQLLVDIPGMHDFHSVATDGCRVLTVWPQWGSSGADHELRGAFFPL